MPRNSRSRRLLLTLLFAAASVTIFAAAVEQKGAAYRFLGVFREVWALVRENYVEPVDEAQLLDGAMRGMAATDAVGAYYAPGEEKPLTAPPAPGRPGFETLPGGGGLVVVRVDEGSPAAKAGLEVGDQVWRIGGKPARQTAWPMARRKLAGPVGGQLDLTILGGRDFKLRQVKVALEAPQGAGYELERREGPVVHLRLGDVERIDAAALGRDLARRLQADRSATLLVDLRGAVSLETDALAKVVGLFAPGAPAARIVPRGGAEEIVPAAQEPRAVPEGRRVVALVDGTTAGIGEALALALKERTGAAIIGRTTYGMGGLPELIPLSRGGAAMVATRELRSAAGTAWADKGIEPDKPLTVQPSASGEDRRDLLLEEALRYVRGDGAPRDRRGA